jgi:RNA polymerase sigma-70 factor (ECF subfamily)
MPDAVTRSRSSPDISRDIDPDTGANTAPKPLTPGANPCSPKASSSEASRSADPTAPEWRPRDSEVVAQAHQRYRAPLEAVAFRILQSRADAEDVVQRIFSALRNADFRGRSSLWTYLYRAAVNGAVNVLRSRRRRARLEDDFLDAALLTDHAGRNPESVVFEGEMLAAIAKALLHVRPQHRRVLTLRILHGLSNTEIAELEGLPLPTVGTWLRRGRQELQQALRPLLRELGRSEG